MNSTHASLKSLRLIHKFPLLAVIALMLATNPPARTGARADDVEPASAGDLDPSFGTGGRVTIDFFGRADEARGVFVLSDGKILVAAAVTNSAGTNVGYGLARLNKDGSLDTSFGNGGKMGPLVFAYPYGCAMQSDARVVMGGTFFKLTRFNPDGSLDGSFGSGGTTPPGFPTGYSSAWALAFYPDGRIVAGGGAGPSATAALDFALARYNANGSLDTSFGTGGRVTTDFSGNSDFVYGVAVQPDGRVIAAGDSYKTVNGENLHDFVLARYNIDGSLDQTFGNGGRVITEFAGGEVAYGLALSGDGRVVAAGLTWGGSTFGNNVALARYNASGNLDSTFGNAGKVITSFGRFNVEAHALAVQPDGRIVQAGYAGTIGGDFAVARYNSDGSLDSSFGTGGKVTTDFAGGLDDAVSIAIQSDGNIVVAGSTGLNSSSDIAVARYKGSGPDFALAFDTPSVSVDRGTKVKVSLQISREPGFTGNVTITAPDIPGIKISPSSDSVADDSIRFKLKIKASAAAGIRELVFTGQDSTGRSRTARLELNIQ
jgi:uncharacterized delta-60 repeat protein